MMKYRPVVAIALVFALVTAPVAAHAAPPANPKPNAVPQPLVKLTGLVVNSLAVVDEELVANATATLEVVGRTITRDVQFPLSLVPIGTGADPCDILSLTLGPINLNLLGLIVNLDDCDEGPVTVKITGTDGLLGDLLCGIADLLNGPLDLEAVLNQLTAPQLAGLLSVVNFVLDGIVDRLLATQIPQAAAMAAAAQANGQCPILDLMLGPIHLELLGLVLDTSQICLDISAQSGPGNLLGNLLCSLTNLLNNRGNNANAQLVLVRNILRVLDGLGL